MISATTPPSFFGKHTVARQLEVAAAVDTAHPAPVRIPVRFDRLPRGLAGLAVTTYYSAAGRRSGVALDFGRTGQRGCAVGTVCTQFGQVALGPRSTAPHLTGEPVAVNRRTAYRYEGAKRPFFTLQLWTGTWLVDFGGKRAVSDQVLTEIARSAHYAASASISTWCDTDDALPF